MSKVCEYPKLSHYAPKQGHYAELCSHLLRLPLWSKFCWHNPPRPTPWHHLWWKFTWQHSERSSRWPWKTCYPLVTSLVTTCCRFSMTKSPVPVTLHSPFPFQLLPWNGLCVQYSAPPSSVDGLNDNELKLFLKEQRNSNPRGKLSLTWMCGITDAGALVRQGQQKTSHQLSSINFSRISSVKKRDGSSYEPDSLTSLQRSLERHLRDNLGKQSSILQDCEFALSWESIVASSKELKKERETSPMHQNLWKVKALNAFGRVEHLVRETQKRCRKDVE